MFKPGADVDDVMSRTTEILGLAPYALRYVAEHVPGEDWVNVVKARSFVVPVRLFPSRAAASFSRAVSTTRFVHFDTCTVLYTRSTNRFHERLTRVHPQPIERPRQDSFAPTKVLDGAWIVPEWSRDASLSRWGASDAESETALRVVLEPGLAFGTGEHPTTRLCLGWLWRRREVLRGAKVVDFGTGSGVIAIGARLMGATRAVGIDLDPMSIRAAAINAELNGIAVGGANDDDDDDGDDSFVLAVADGSRDEDLPDGLRGDVDVLVANILVGPVVALAPLFASYVKPGGSVCLSGVLETQTPAVIEAYEAAGFEALTRESEDGWAVVSGVRK